MPTAPDPKHIRKLKKNLDRLWNAQPHKMGAMKKNPLYGSNTHQGVYAVTDPEDQNVVYIGKTNGGSKENGVADRVWGHCETGSDLQDALNIGPAQMKDHNVRTIPITDPGERGLTELYGIAVCAPKGNRFGLGRPAIDLDDPVSADPK